MTSTSNTDMIWVTHFLSQIVPRSGEFQLNNPLHADECKWFRAGMENGLLKIRDCVPDCPRLKKWKETGPDEFITSKGKCGIRHLFSLSNPAAFNWEYLPHIAAYARLILDLGYKQEYSAFSFYRTFSRDLISKKAGGSYETDAEFYDKYGKLYLHVEVKRLLNKQTSWDRALRDTAL